MNNEIKIKRKQNGIVPLLPIVLLISFLSGILFYSHYFQYGYSDKNQLLLLDSHDIISSAGNSLLQLILTQNAHGTLSNISDSNNTPIGSNITTKDISDLAAVFIDQPFQGGQVSPRVAKWVNNDVFIFLQFDERNASNATAINYIGVGKRGTFCEEDRPSPDFVHFHKWNATEYKHGHGSKAGDEGYWLMWVATGEFNMQGRHVTAGVDREFSPTPPPPRCSIDIINTN
jgi:hypothetical protein